MGLSISGLSTDRLPDDMPQDASAAVEAAARDPRRLMYGQSTAWPLLHMPSPHASSHGAASVALGDSFKARARRGLTARVRANPTPTLILTTFRALTRF